MGTREHGAALLVAASILSTAASSFGFCRTTTCDADGSVKDCKMDSTGCSTSGHPLQWRSPCVSFSAEKDSSAKRHISYQTFDETIKLAFQRWASVDCGGGTHPSFRMWDFDQTYGPSLCDEPEYNDEAPNADVWMFRDTTWPYEGRTSTLALTTITFEVASGEILDADVEVNSYAANLTTSDDDVHADLLSIVTHEAGHFLGLSHSKDRTATMYATYSDGDTSFRSLSADDQQAICAVYPPDRPPNTCSRPTPTHGFSRYCAAQPSAAEACSVASLGVAPRPGLPGSLAGLALSIALGRRRRRWRWPRRRRSRT